MEFGRPSNYPLQGQCSKDIIGFQAFLLGIPKSNKSVSNHKMSPNSSAATSSSFVQFLLCVPLFELEESIRFQSSKVWHFHPSQCGTFVPASLETGSRSGHPNTSRKTRIRGPLWMTMVVSEEWCLLQILYLCTSKFTNMQVWGMSLIRGVYRLCIQTTLGRSLAKWKFFNKMFSGVFWGRILATHCRAFPFFATSPDLKELRNPSQNWL